MEMQQGTTTPAAENPRQPASPAEAFVAELAETVLAELRAHANAENVAGMARFGIGSRGTLGVGMPVVRSAASAAKRALREAARGGRSSVSGDAAEPRSQPAPLSLPAARLDLAERLWASGVHEALIAAALVVDPVALPREVAERWVLDLDSWDTCDQLCQNVLWKTPYAWGLPDEWTLRRETFVKRAGFVVAAQLGGKDKRASDEQVIGLLGVIDERVLDERNDVKKAASWTLRQIGKRNAVVNAAAIEAAERLLGIALAETPATPASKAARWVARDALRELRSDAVRQRLGQ